MISPDLIVTSPARISPSLANKLPNYLALEKPNDISRNPSLCSCVSLPVNFITPFEKYLNLRRVLLFQKYFFFLHWFWDRKIVI